MRRLTALFIILSCIMIDISSKSFIQTIENSTNINSYITIYVTSNTGVAFSFLNNLEGTGNLILNLIILIILILLSVILYKNIHSEKTIFFGLSLILGGGYSNYIDRSVDGAVIDFIIIHYEDIYFPAVFNIADVFISVGAFLVLLSYIYSDGKNYKV